MVAPAATFLLKLTVLVAFLGVAAASGHAQAPSSFEQRRQAALAQYTQGTSVKTDCDGEDLRGTCNVMRPLSFAIATLFRGSAVDAGNASIADSIMAIRQVILSERWRTAERRAAIGAAVPLHMLVRTYFLFGPKGSRAPGRLSEANQSAIREIVWEYAKGQCLLATADVNRVWVVRGSENINLLEQTLCWGAAEALADVPARRYDDASTTVQQKTAWTKYLREFISQRGKFGGLTEFFSTYYKYTMIGILNVADFASDLSLRKLTSSFLDVWSADWAEEQIDGLHGGSKARIYSTVAEPGLVMIEPAWFYFEIGGMPKGIGHPAFIFMLTSSYRPPEIVEKIATRKVTFGYVVRSRRPGLLVSAGSDQLDAKAGGILRYTYVSPNFVMGTSMLARRPVKDWSAASSQNRWDGLVLHGGGERYLSVRPADAAGSVYNSAWGVQVVGTQIIQKLAPPYGNRSGPMTIRYGRDLKPEREGDWVFFDSSAYVAVRAVFGKLENKAGVPSELTVIDDLSPVIVSAAEKSEFASFEDFKAKMLRAPLTSDAESVQFLPPQGRSTIRFFYRSGRLAEIDGRPIDIAPAFGFESPYLKSLWGQGVVTITYGHEQIIRDFAN